MQFIALFKGIVAIAAAVPVIKDLIDSFIGFYADSQIENIKDMEIGINEKRYYVIKKIKEAKTNEERFILSKLLADVERM